MKSHAQIVNCISWRVMSAKQWLLDGMAQRQPGIRLITVLFLGCLTAAHTTAQAIPSPKAKPSAQSISDAAFSTWINQFRQDALKQGISTVTFDLAFAGVSVSQSVLTASERQPELERRIWTYLNGAVSDHRIKKGREMLAAHRSLLQSVYETYGVQPQVIVAIWGLESSFGAATGRTDIVEALTTIAFKGRRKDYARRELMAVLTILEKGYATRSQLRGSWAGAMGHTQFIPSTYLGFAVDNNQDGRRDLWGELSDVFASTANYLAKWNWQRSQSWGREVTLPPDFNYSLADSRIIKSVKDWSKLGLKSVAPTSLEDDINQSASLLLPGGHKGPAFLTYQNFRSILRYNNSTAYALAVSHLADRIAGAKPLQGKWPMSEEPLSKFDRIDMQQRLNRLGYEPGRVDGIIGARTRAALRLYQKDIGVPADGFPTLTVLGRLRQNDGANP